jgi:isocitrate dehydrogenase (NAD+)
VGEVTIVRVAGDGVGPELVDAGTQIFDAAGVDVRWIDMPAGLGAYHTFGATAPAETIDAIRTYGAAMKGPFATPSAGEIRSANHYLRRELDLYACLRPVPIDLDRPILLVRENVEDMYAAVEWWAAPGVAQGIKTATRQGCERIARYAFDLARREGRSSVTLVHKANNLKLTEGLFLDVATAVAGDYPEIEFRDMLADTACSTFVLDPEQFDVIVTSNTFGDLLSNIGAAVAGSLGLVGSINSGAGIHVAEAAHGDASQLAGKDQVNPIAFFDSVRLLMAAMGLAAQADRLRRALVTVRRAGPRTLDLGGAAATSDITRAVCAQLSAGAGA